MRTRAPLRLTLRENVPGLPVALTQREIDDLRRVAQSVAIAPAPGQPGHYVLTPGSKVGTVDLGTLAIEIQPKIPVDRVLFLISYAVDPRRWRDEVSPLGTAPSLVEALIPGFVAQVRRAVRRGLLAGYRVWEDALPAVRGRIRFEEQLRRRFGRFPPAEVRFDEFTEDIEENRILKAAVVRLGHLRIRSSVVRQSLRAFDVAFSQVSSIAYNPRQLPVVHYTRLNQHYRPALELARLILRSTSLELRGGEVAASAFLVDMATVFEDFVVVALRDALGLSERSWPQGAAGRWLPLDEAGQVRLEPDLSWWEGDRCVFVGDAKYKRVEASGIRHPDLYQLLAYVVAAGLPAGLLVYAAGESEPAQHRVVCIGKTLHVVAVDLAGSPDDILGQAARVAEKVRTMCSMLQRSVA